MVRDALKLISDDSLMPLRNALIEIYGMKQNVSWVGLELKILHRIKACAVVY